MSYQAAEDLDLVLEYELTIASADKGKDFRFKVAAENSLGMGEYSDPIILTAADEPAAPALSLVTGHRTQTSVRLLFTPDADTGESPIIGYLLYRDEGVDGSPYTLYYNGTGKPEIIY